LVVLSIKVWRTRTLFLVRHPWILDWLESTKTRTGSNTTYDLAPTKSRLDLGFVAQPRNRPPTSSCCSCHHAART
jgi:hypothetical protein